MKILENLFNVNLYLNKENIDIRSKEPLRDPWVQNYIPELYITSERINKGVADIIEKVLVGNCICSIIGDFKSGKTYLAKLLAEGFKQSLHEYCSYNKFYVIFLTPDNFPERYSLSNFMRIISQEVLGKYYQSKEKIIVELKKHISEENALLIIFIDNFTKESLLQILSDSLKLTKLLKNHYSCIFSCSSSDYELCTQSLGQRLTSTCTSSFHIPSFDLEQTSKLLQIRLNYAYMKSNIEVSSIFDKDVLEKAWIYSDGNPWILLSLFSDSFAYAKSVGANKVTEKHLDKVRSLFSRKRFIGDLDDGGDKFLIQQALNEFPNRERQVCEYLLYKDATAKEITKHLYGDIKAQEYRTKYMGTKSFIRRLRDKNMIVIKGKRGRALLFGINPNLKAYLQEKKV